mmetsp:Transcript_9806/g.18176  ORF Transcript_9806/g.18176 Transcript_9806/m.18176 type:complete len:1897 (+) Transcript_9806:204-5894(+)
MKFRASKAVFGRLHSGGDQQQHHLQKNDNGDAASSVVSSLASHSAVSAARMLSKSAKKGFFSRKSKGISKEIRVRTPVPEQFDAGPDARDDRFESDSIEIVERDDGCIDVEASSVASRDIASKHTVSPADGRRNKVEISRGSPVVRGDKPFPRRNVGVSLVEVARRDQDDCTYVSAFNKAKTTQSRSSVKRTCGKITEESSVGTSRTSKSITSASTRIITQTASKPKTQGVSISTSRKHDSEQSVISTRSSVSKTSLRPSSTRKNESEPSVISTRSSVSQTTKRSSKKKAGRVSGQLGKSTEHITSPYVMKPTSPTSSTKQCSDQGKSANKKKQASPSSAKQQRSSTEPNKFAGAKNPNSPVSSNPRRTAEQVRSTVAKTHGSAVLKPRNSVPQETSIDGNKESSPTPLRISTKQDKPTKAEKQVSHPSKPRMRVDRHNKYTGAMEQVLPSSPSRCSIEEGKNMAKSASAPRRSTVERHLPKLGGQAPSSLQPRKNNKGATGNPKKTPTSGSRPQKEDAKEKLKPTHPKSRTSTQGKSTSDSATKFRETNATNQAPESGKSEKPSSQPRKSLTECKSNNTKNLSPLSLEKVVGDITTTVNKAATDRAEEWLKKKPTPGTAGNKADEEKKAESNSIVTVKNKGIMKPKNADDFADSNVSKLSSQAATASSSNTLSKTRAKGIRKSLADSAVAKRLIRKKISTNKNTLSQELVKSLDEKLSRELSDELSSSPTGNSVQSRNLNADEYYSALLDELASAGSQFEEYASTSSSSKLRNRQLRGRNESKGPTCSNATSTLNPIPPNVVNDPDTASNSQRMNSIIEEKKIALQNMCGSCKDNYFSSIDTSTRDLVKSSTTARETCSSFLCGDIESGVVTNFRVNSCRENITLIESFIESSANLRVNSCRDNFSSIETSAQDVIESSTTKNCSIGLCGEIRSRRVNANDGSTSADQKLDMPNFCISCRENVTSRETPVLLDLAKSSSIRDQNQHPTEICVANVNAGTGFDGFVQRDGAFGAEGLINAPTVDDSLGVAYSNNATVDDIGFQELTTNGITSVGNPSSIDFSSDEPSPNYQFFTCGDLSQVKDESNGIAPDTNAIKNFFLSFGALSHRNTHSNNIDSVVSEESPDEAQQQEVSRQGSNFFNDTEGSFSNAEAVGQEHNANSQYDASSNEVLNIADTPTANPLRYFLWNVGLVPQSDVDNKIPVEEMTENECDVENCDQDVGLKTDSDCKDDEMQHWLCQRNPCIARGGRSVVDNDQSPGVSPLLEGTRGEADTLDSYDEGEMNCEEGDANVIRDIDGVASGVEECLDEEEDYDDDDGLSADNEDEDGEMESDEDETMEYDDHSNGVDEEEFDTFDADGTIGNDDYSERVEECTLEEESSDCDGDETLDDNDGDDDSDTLGTYDNTVDDTLDGTLDDTLDGTLNGTLDDGDCDDENTQSFESYDDGYNTLSESSESYNEQGDDGSTRESRFNQDYDAGTYHDDASGSKSESFEEDEFKMRSESLGDDGKNPSRSRWFGLFSRQASSSTYSERDSMTFDRGCSDKNSGIDDVVITNASSESAKEEETKRPSKWTVFNRRRQNNDKSFRRESRHAEVDVIIENASLGEPQCVEDPSQERTHDELDNQRVNSFLRSTSEASQKDSSIKAHDFGLPSGTSEESDDQHQSVKSFSTSLSKSRQRSLSTDSHGGKLHKDDSHSRIINKSNLPLEKNRSGVGNSSTFESQRIEKQPSLTYVMEAAASGLSTILTNLSGHAFGEVESEMSLKTHDSRQPDQECDRTQLSTKSDSEEGAATDMAVQVGEVSEMIRKSFKESDILKAFMDQELSPDEREHIEGIFHPKNLPFSDDSIMVLESLDEGPIQLVASCPSNSSESGRVISTDSFKKKTRKRLNSFASSRTK